MPEPVAPSGPASLAHYLVTQDDTGLQIHQYAPATIEAELPMGPVALRMETDYPWQGQVRIAVVEAGGQSWRLALRLPAWCQAPILRVNGQPVSVAPDGAGYAAVERAWRPGDLVELDLALAPRLTEAHPHVDATRGSVAIERGPVVYCLEQIDQDPALDLMGVEIDTTQLLESRWQSDLLGGVTVVQSRGHARELASWQGRLYRPLGGRPVRRTLRLMAVPYYAWANRSPGAMGVWIPAAGDGPSQ